VFYHGRFADAGFANEINVGKSVGLTDAEWHEVPMEIRRTEI
jgi:hypothetical protein